MTTSNFDFGSETEICHELDYFEELKDLVESGEIRDSLVKLKNLNEVLHYILIEEKILEDPDGNKMILLEQKNNLSTIGLVERCEQYGRLKHYDIHMLLSMFRLSVVFLKMVGVDC